ncbi:hypothetical protein PQR14_23335 [Paraburkholderia bryophila]|uniref:hypothetical protein n=1 Tax=Burkholderiaceae TaxID=119060 RepID=UPI00068CF1F6|nr:hypothetical protein [Burkholderia sp. 9120]
MSENQGKDGEMRFGIALAGAAIREDSLDFTRHTTTNQSDLGVDYSLRGDVKALLSFCEIGAGKNLPSVQEILGDTGKQIEARVDVKTTREKLTGAAVKKFVQDIKKHPNTDLHVLAGGKDLTKSAKKDFESHQENFSRNGKALVYIPNDGVVRLVGEYKNEINSAFNGLLGSNQGESKG